jgi:hypothetical protein
MTAIEQRRPVDGADRARTRDDILEPFVCGGLVGESLGHLETPRGRLRRTLEGGQTDRRWRLKCSPSHQKQ